METQEQSKTDAVTHMVQEAKLQTDFLQSFSFVRHTVRNHAAEGSSLKEWWEPERYIGCGGFGSVQLQRCYDVDVLWDDSEYEEEGDDGGAKIKVGTLRAVKQISKPRDQVKLSGQFLHELHSLVFFATPKYQKRFVKTYGWYEDEQTLYIAIEYLAFGDLQSHLMDKGPVAEADAKTISKQVLRGLQFMHEEDFVHGDLKPANLLVKDMPPNGKWWIKISDLGLSKEIEQSRTLSSTVCGTLGFMAPELLGFNTTPGSQLPELDKLKAADMWAFGETVYRLLTGVASLGDNIQDLCKYVQGQKAFPQGPLEGHNVSDAGIVFIRRCLDPRPIDRPSPISARRQFGWLMIKSNKGYKKMNTKITGTLSCEGSQPPFILFTPDGAHLIAIDANKVLVWNIESKTVVNRHVSPSDMQFCHGSVQPGGRYLCVTQTTRQRPLILEDMTSPGHAFFIDDDLDAVGTHSTISTFSPDGQTLVTARNDQLCKIKVEHGWSTSKRSCVAATQNRETRENIIKDLRFMNDGSKLIAACETKVIIIGTRTSRWIRAEVIEYPFRASGINISPDGMSIACGSIIGDLWFRKLSKIGEWSKLRTGLGSPGATSEAVDNVRFSATGCTLLYNHCGDSEVNMREIDSIERTCLLTDLRDAPGQRMGHSLMDPRRRSGATAYGGQSSARVIFWEYEL